VLEIGDKVLLLGVASVMSAGILRKFHMVRIIRYLKENHVAIWESLAGGRYRKNPLIFQYRINTLIDDNGLQRLGDDELNRRISMLRIFDYGAGLGGIITIVGVIVLINP